MCRVLLNNVVFCVIMEKSFCRFVRFSVLVWVFVMVIWLVFGLIRWVSRLKMVDLFVFDVLIRVVVLFVFVVNDMFCNIGNLL